MIEEQSLTPDEGSSWTRARSWLVNDALPLWSNQGFDPSRNVFHERLTLQGIAVDEAPRRLMVQARQIFSYATAARHGWMTGADHLVRKGASSMVRDYFEADGRPGWVMAVDCYGNVVDDRRDLYGSSFVLLAMAAVFETTRDDEYLALADRTLQFLDSMMINPGGGYIPSFPQSADSELLQNPHMHLFEAILALYLVAPKHDYKIRLEKILALMETRFFQSSTRILCEYFDSDWMPVPGERGHSFEPGHHYEWVWLLDRYSRVFDCGLPGCAEALFHKAQSNGHSATGLIWSVVRSDGSVIDDSFLLWPHTEVIKANLSEPRGNGLGAATISLARLYETFLTPACRGGWHDRFASDGRLLATYIPASSLYHIVCAFSEYETQIRHLHGSPVTAQSR